MNILGISRSPRFSPNSVDRDAAIFAAVATRMQRGGNHVSVISEDLFVSVDLSEFDLVFSMARGTDVLESLAQAEETQSLRVINSARALMAMARHRLVEVLKQHEIPQPPFQVLRLQSDGKATQACSLSYPLWVKRGDACAQQANDVCYLSTPEEMPDVLLRFAAQGVQTVVVVEHATGDLVKFYGVADTDFLFYTYPTEGKSFSKFGLECHNDVLRHTPFDARELKRVADYAARVSGFTVYGGDAIVGPDGRFVIIDFNDWPSFSPCRKEAARAIAEALKK